ncbi:MAG: vitamin K epoxide reductase family protein [bacterium]
MQFSDDILIRIGMFVLGVCGFFVAKHIHKHKQEGEAPLVCPVGFDCNAVVHSDYSKMMGVPLELLGMTYYALISVAYFIFIFVGENMPGMAIGFLMLASFGAFLFSLYLIGVQIFVLKKGCSWCMVSAAISVLIFILTSFAYDFSSIAQIFSK